MRSDGEGVIRRLNGLEKVRRFEIKQLNRCERTKKGSSNGVDRKT